MDSKTQFIDYYEVLRIWPTADAATIKKAYFKLAKIHHPDIAGNADSDGVDFKLINEAFSVLNDPVQRREFDEQLKTRTASGVVSQRKDADKRSAQLAYDQARAAMKQNRYDKAAMLLKSAVKYDPTNPAYFSWYGFTLGVLKTHLHEARDACRKALEMEFYNADYHANLGFVYHQAGLTSTAQECFEEALKWDPEHVIALKYHKGGSRAPGQSKKDGLFSFFRRNKKSGKARKSRSRGSGTSRVNITPTQKTRKA